ncbi:MinD/ParA family ATP-binding protein [Halococcoides cellulosivorans]|uniref:Septum site-determining protein MinD n=1 Tax=Halococcoides cellulosivorans TaxID=1679096 RepID=A0A2R4X2R5_9EURY|nr:AAA family ATPase [Halococcoides cellulosivorans]AWB28090.1 septum site-determining protein MinD [Halococcoides cellulosivorans]
MTGHVFTIAGGKGGVGKTTTAINLGVALEEDGYDVVVVDADLGMANLAAMLAVDHETSIHEVLAEDAAISDTLTDAPGGTTIVPGEQSLDAFADADPAKLRKVVKTLANAYDVVLVDTGAGLSHEATVPLGLADSIILVTTPDSVAIANADKTAQLAQRVDGRVVGTVLTRSTDRSDLDAVEDELNYDVAGVIPEDSEAAGTEPLVIHAPDSPAARAYRTLAGRIEQIVEGDPVPDVVGRPIEWFDGDDERADDEDDEDGDGGGLRSLLPW